MFIILFGIITFGLSSCNLTDKKTVPTAQRGIIDLRAWDFQKKGTIDLTGEWEFYWKNFYSYHDFVNNKQIAQPDYLQIGTLWNSLFKNKYPRQGFGTYRLKILLNDTSSFFSIFLNEAPISASRIYINNELIGSNGKLSDNSERYEPSFLIDIKPFKGDSVLNLIIQVANYEHNRSGGIFYNPVFGNVQNIVFYKQKYFVTNLLLLGGIIIVMLYHFALFLLIPQQKSNFYLSLLSFFVFLYFSTLFYLQYFINDFQLVRHIRMSAWFFAVPVLAFFVNSIFNIKNSNKFIGIFTFLSIFSLVLFFLKVEYILYFYLIVSLITAVYVLIIAFVNLYKKYFDAKVFFLGILLVSLSSIYDTLIYMQIIHTTSLLPLGFFLFLLSQSYILVHRFANTYKINKELSIQLVNANKNLEKIVLERTKKIEEQNVRLAELNATKDHFFGIIAHNLRGPVGNWTSSLGLLIDTYDRLNDETKLELITSLKSSTDKTFHLLENLLIWSRIQRGIITYSPQKVLFQELIDESIEFVKPSADFKNISISINNEKDLRIYCDVYMMNNILRNLLSNAIKFTPENGSISVSTHKNNEYVELTISDTGIGINPKVIHKLFKIEQNILSKGTKGETGSGLGLILCKEFIDRHKGYINIHSEPGKGTTVSVKFPHRHSTDL
ncbi:MAG: sensor histidine kinase [Bacteroidales bacterium]|nr:sensor histidine kinase [Bacteroidales bacterium]